MPATNNVTTGKPKVAGSVHRAVTGTTLPTDASSALAGAFVDMGYVSDGGVVNSNKPATTKVKDWGGQTVLVVTTEKPDTFKIKFIEALNPNVLEAVYNDDNVTVNGGAGTIAVTVNADEPKEASYVIDMVMRNGALKRIVIPCAVISDVADITYKADEAVGYEITLDALPDSSGNSHYEYIQLASGTVIALALDKSTLSVAHGSTSQLVATTTPAGMHVVWGSSDTSKATVDQSGLVTGVAAGSATISATWAGITKTCTVTVT